MLLVPILPLFSLIPVHRMYTSTKQKAAEWAQTALPDWSSLIQNALIWRDDKREEQVDHNATYPLTARFVHFIIDRIVG